MDLTTIAIVTVVVFTAVGLYELYTNKRDAENEEND